MCRTRIVLAKKQTLTVLLSIAIGFAATVFISIGVRKNLDITFILIGPASYLGSSLFNIPVMTYAVTLVYYALISYFVCYLIVFKKSRLILITVVLALVVVHTLMLLFAGDMLAQDIAKAARVWFTSGK